MKIKLIALIVLAGGIVAFGLLRTGSTGQKKSPPPIKDRLKWYAKEAKDNGRQKVTVPTDVIEYLGSAGTITAEEAFSSSTVVIAYLVAQESYGRSNNITTWNKFAIDEVLSEAKELPCPTCGPSDPPAALLPVHSGEFVIPKAGGTVNIDGIEIEQTGDGFPPYEFNQRYLLLIFLYPNGTAGTIGGPVGVFRIVGDKVLPVQESDHRILKDFKEKYGNSLARLRKRLKDE
ncbi:MAG TPA: hypothetical protein VN843_17645 [Anaerolineales bacterium]|nr:hypothetical protein [Anaerolineales bacterium]